MQFVNTQLRSSSTSQQLAAGLPVPGLMLALSLFFNAAARGEDPLPSWSDGLTKQKLQSFVAGVVAKGGAHYVAAAERIAVFDNDGTLWCEQPIYRSSSSAWTE